MMTTLQPAAPVMNDREAKPAVAANADRTKPTSPAPVATLPIAIQQVIPVCRRVPHRAVSGKAWNLALLCLALLEGAPATGQHGYDIVDHTAFNPELGTEPEFAEFVSELHAHGMSLILDFVPNHMAVATNDNAWWMDVLEDEPSSPYAAFFDIDWMPLKPDLALTRCCYRFWAINLAACWKKNNWSCLWKKDLFGFVISIASFRLLPARRAEFCSSTGWKNS